eukprot:scaffold17263_cov147-Skeletonema_dohrnii-CCMP3373.AAC.5
MGSISASMANLSSPSTEIAPTTPTAPTAHVAPAAPAPKDKKAKKKKASIKSDKAVSSSDAVPPAAAKKKKGGKKRDSYKDDDEDYASSPSSPDSSPSSPEKKKKRKKKKKAAATKTSSKTSKESKGSINTNTKPAMCDHKRGGMSRTCNMPVLTTAPADGVTLDPTKCGNHQPCSMCESRVVGDKPTYQRLGICKQCKTGKKRKDEEAAEEAAQTKKLEQILPQLPERVIKRGRKVKELINNEVLSPPAGKVAGEVTTDDVVKDTVEPIVQLTLTSTTSSSDYDEIKGVKGSTLIGCKVFLIHGNHENSLGTEREVTQVNIPKGGGGGTHTYTLAGIDKLHVKADFIILRDEKGRKLEGEFLNSNSGKKFTFVDSKDGVDFMEKESRVILKRTNLPLYAMEKDGSVVVRSKLGGKAKIGLGLVPKSENDDAIEKASRWLDGTGYTNWAKLEAEEQGGKLVGLEAIKKQMERLGLRYERNSTPEGPPKIPEDEDDRHFHGRFTRPADEDYDMDSDELRHVLNYKGCANVDFIANLNDNEKPSLFHTTCHAGRGGANMRFMSGDNIERKNQNYHFNMADFIDNQTDEDWAHLVSHYGPRLRNMGYGGAGATNESALRAYLEECNNKQCLMGTAYLQGRQLDQSDPNNDNGSPLNYAPHVTNRKLNNPRVYASGSLTKCVRRFRTKRGWERHYGWGRPHGKRCTVCITNRKFWALIERSVNLHDSTWRKICENGNWILRANQVDLTYNQANAAH